MPLVASVGFALWMLYQMALRCWLYICFVVAPPAERVKQEEEWKNERRHVDLLVDMLPKYMRDTFVVEAVIV